MEVIALGLLGYLGAALSNEQVFGAIGSYCSVVDAATHVWATLSKGQLIAHHCSGARGGELRASRTTIKLLEGIVLELLGLTGGCFDHRAN